MKYYANYINRRGESCSLPFFSLDVAEDYCYLLVLAGDIKGFTIDVYDCDYSDYDARRLVDSFIHLDSDPETFREAVRRFGTIEAKRKYGVDVDSVNTAEQGEPVDVENTSASEQDNTADKRTCETCKYRNIYFRCDCHSSHLFNRDLKYDYSCIFYVNKNHYDDVFRSGG